MKNKIIVCFTLVIFLLSFRMNVYAESVFYLSYDESGNESLETESLEFYGNFTDEEKAHIMFEILFSGKYLFVPDGTRVIDIQIVDGVLFLNVTGEIISYGGGSSYERRLIVQILKTALDIHSVKRVTLLVEGFLEYLPEGSLIFEENRIPHL